LHNLPLDKHKLAPFKATLIELVKLLTAKQIIDKKQSKRISKAQFINDLTEIADEFE